MTILLPETSKAPFFTNCLFVFDILSIIVLNFSRSNVQTNGFKNILKTFEKSFHSFALIFLMLIIWQFNISCISVFLSLIFTMALTLVFRLRFYSTDFEYLCKT